MVVKGRAPGEASCVHFPSDLLFLHTADFPFFKPSLSPFQIHSVTSTRNIFFRVAYGIPIPLPPTT
jgi:hypothetical protein